MMAPEKLKALIEAALPGATVHVLDPLEDGEHLQAIVISAAFEGMSLIRQHQMVMRPLKDALAGAVHALTLKTFTPPKWEKEDHHG
jgi:acid stress-induced BolA-like protein IbaG/YrbA